MAAFQVITEAVCDIGTIFIRIAPTVRDPNQQRRNCPIFPPLIIKIDKPIGLSIYRGAATEEGDREHLGEQGGKLSIPQVLTLHPESDLLKVLRHQCLHTFQERCELCRRPELRNRIELLKR
jgi:hypothetical protein